MKKYLKFFKYLIPYWKKEALILFLSGAGVLLSLVNPFLSKLVIDKAYGNRDLKLFIILTICGAIVFIISTAISAISNYLGRYISLFVTFNLQRRVFAKIQGLPYIFFQNTSTAENLYKINYDIDRVSRFITETLPRLVTLVLRLIFITAVLLYLNWRMALLALSLSPLLYTLDYYALRRFKQLIRGWIEASQEAFRRLQETLGHLHLIKALGREKQQARIYIRNLAQKIRLDFKSARLETAVSSVSNLAGRLILGLVMLYGGYQVIKGKMLLGSLVAVALYLNQFSGLHNSIVAFFQQVSIGTLSCERIGSILERPSEAPENKGARKTIFYRGGIEFKDASFGYRPEKLVLDNVSFSIAGAAKIALTGPSGCGKTTLVNLILRLYKLNAGNICIDGWDIRDISASSFYSQIGVALQEPYLWNDTIENNIRFGKIDATDKEVQEAARIARIDEFIDSLPEGYNTVIGENACKISEGQKQRIAIARALIKKPKILIFDEAFCAIDAQTETGIIESINVALKEATTIVISHHISTIRRMDAVYFLDFSGKLRIGSHEELIRSDISYQHYFANCGKERNLLEIL